MKLVLGMLDLEIFQILGILEILGDIGKYGRLEIVQRLEISEI